MKAIIDKQERVNSILGIKNKRIHREKFSENK
jgi:hypothetical protein